MVPISFALLGLIVPAAGVEIVASSGINLEAPVAKGHHELEPSKYDLHFHSTLSNGTTPWQDLAKMINEYGMKAVSLTDHNKLATREVLVGFRKAVNKETWIIPGVEMTGTWETTLENPPCKGGKPGKVTSKDVHLLGYFPLQELAVCRPKGHSIDDFPTQTEVKDFFKSIGVRHTGSDECPGRQRQKWSAFTMKCEELIKGRVLRNRLIAHNIRELFRIEKMRELYRFNDFFNDGSNAYDQITVTMPEVELEMFGRPNFYKWATKQGMSGAKAGNGLFGPEERLPLAGAECMWFTGSDKSTKLPPLLHDCMQDEGWSRLMKLMNEMKRPEGPPYTYVGMHEPEHKQVLDEEVAPETAHIYALPPVASASLGELSSMIKGLGGVAVLAHPKTILFDTSEVGCGRTPFLKVQDAALQELVKGVSDLWGLEAFSAEINEEEHVQITALAALTNKRTTGGSDFHGIDSPKKHKSAFAILQSIGNMNDHNVEQPQFTAWKATEGQRATDQILHQFEMNMGKEQIQSRKILRGESVGEASRPFLFLLLGLGGFWFGALDV